MKKVFLAFALGLVVFASCNRQKDDTDQDTTQVQLVALNERLTMAQDSKDSLIFLMSDIYSGIEEINVQEGLLYNLRGNENSAQKAEIIENLSRIKAELLDKQAKLDALTAQFNSANDKNGQLVKEISSLKNLISQKEAKIGELENQLKNAQAHITNLQDTVATTRQQVRDVTAEKELAQTQVAESKAENEKLVNDANRVYYAIGTKKELQKNNILTKKKVMQGDYEMGYFKQGDRRTLTSIPCYNKKVKILTNQPQDSYRIEEGADKAKTIVITNPARFWGTTDFLVIQVG